VLQCVTQKTENKGKNEMVKRTEFCVISIKLRGCWNAGNGDSIYTEK
jgi:hypothetical protein